MEMSCYNMQASKQAQKVAENECSVALAIWEWKQRDVSQSQWQIVGRRGEMWTCADFKSVLWDSRCVRVNLCERIYNCMRKRERIRPFVYTIWLFCISNALDLITPQKQSYFMTLGQTISTSLLCYSRFSTFWQRSLSLSQWLWPPTCWQSKQSSVIL